MRAGVWHVERLGLWVISLHWLRAVVGEGDDSSHRQRYDTSLAFSIATLSSRLS